MLRWLLGKKAETVEDARNNSKREAAGDVAAQTVAPSHQQELNKQAPANPETENLRRWRESGQARAWVERHQGGWNHADWLALLEELKASPFWPMNADAVGLVLEEIKRERLKRN
jgi:hypothetical protein